MWNGASHALFLVATELLSVRTEGSTAEALERFSIGSLPTKTDHGAPVKILPTVAFVREFWPHKSYVT